jgi:hypothetical protein
MKQEPHGPPADWWTVTCNGVPVMHFTPGRKADAERYATDPAYRADLAKSQKYHER